MLTLKIEEDGKEINLQPHENIHTADHLLLPIYLEVMQ